MQVKKQQLELDMEQWSGSKLRKEYVKAAYCDPAYFIYMQSTSYIRDFPDSSVGKESACNAGDLGSIPGLGRSPGEGIGYPLQYLWASFLAQLVKNMPAMQETWIESLDWEDPLEKGKATHSIILA